MSAAGEAKPNRGPKGAALRESRLPTRSFLTLSSGSRRQR